MKHTECKDCELSNGDCGHHFEMDGTTNFDIASLSSCDRYGNCEFFKSKEISKGDLISRKELKDAIEMLFKYGGYDSGLVMDTIDNVPSVEPEKVLVANVTFDKDELARLIDERVIEPIKNGELVIKEERPQGKWIDRMEDKGYVECPFCHKQISGGDLNFCVKCGADMRKGDKT